MAITLPPETPESYVHPETGVTWYRRPRATSTAEEHQAALTRWRALHRELNWALEDERPALREEEGAIEKVVFQWGHDADLTYDQASPEEKERLDAEAEERAEQWHSDWDARHEAERRAKEELYASRKSQYDPDRERARYELLDLLHESSNREADLAEDIQSQEDQKLLPAKQRPKRERRVHARVRFEYPAVDRSKVERRDGENRSTAIDRAIVEHLRGRIEELRQRVGDPETVLDHDGRLPADRRSVTRFQYWLRPVLVDRYTRAAAAYDEAGDKAERFRDAAERIRAIRYLTDEQMCPDCSYPQDWHEGDDQADDLKVLCAKWPSAERERLWHERLRETVDSMKAARQETPAPTAPEPPKQRPGSRKTKAQLLDENDALRAEIERLKGSGSGE